jgi:metal-responsive CopG/Arc/MetJ family transcriptional regulator
MKRINITIDDKALEQLDKIAAKEGRTRSGQIRELVKKEAKK